MAGLLLFIVGFRAYRVSAALIAAIVGAVAVSRGISYWHVRVSTSVELAMAAGSLAAALLALLWPGFVTVVAMATTGLLLAKPLLIGADAETRLLVTTVSVAAGAIFPAILYSWLPALLVPPVASCLVSLGAWGLFGLEHSKHVLYRVPAAWLGLAGLLTLAGWFIENRRLEKRLLQPAEQKKGKAQR